jgi:hypothetical protein
MIDELRVQVSGQPPRRTLPTRLTVDKAVSEGLPGLMPTSRAWLVRTGPAVGCGSWASCRGFRRVRNGAYAAVAALNLTTSSAGIRPRSFTSMPCFLAQSRISAEPGPLVLAVRLRGDGRCVLETRLAAFT